ncbi:hypothetical protein BKH42_02155 [Helicobacter sp. 13S00482-2]|uniref:hypothetical protein n=1 Tax=Helicobacter sp. 13S00482-2 TaxID=1476200 RepID=UPI000BA68029|nr:hypothetical protein [Helicobacter sp. 13S00482-2]PAF54326.1 hypothetical protein BKH42_02155 [Helicobacter sp. 13S00482-2]
MKKIIVSIIALGVLENIALGNEANERTQRLEKENRILEIDKKNQEFQVSDKNNLDNDNGLVSKVKETEKRSKDGYFGGIEGVLGISEVKVSTGDPYPFKGSTTIFDLGFAGGGQYYFGISQRHGFKWSVHGDYSFGNSYNLASDDGYKTTMSYDAFKIGFDLKYLWDFLEIDKHTLGLNVGVGYEIGLYLNGKSPKDYPSTNLSSFSTENVYPVIGLHYYHENHQFELMYRFMYKVNGIFNGGIREEKNGVAINSEAKNIILTNRSYLTVSYTYKI